ncbi:MULTISPECIES: hypothetical protein [unclassified Exiguobacterium]|uniref:hypothetical protein n=1 Tax=unclassified Exiguobacterium TaxID=2644629 RepID=UPI001BE4F761|nr:MULTISPECIES: hypothetical protein [unclassified Exiguobacterium]
MNRQQKIVLILVFMFLVSSGVVWAFDSTKQPQLPEGAEPILTYPLDDRDMSLRFFMNSYIVEEWSEEPVAQGIGLELTVDDRVQSITSESLSEEGLTWSTFGQSCGDTSACAPYDILYGMNHGETTRVVVELNGDKFEPELLKTKAGNDVWFVLVDQIESIESITGYDAEGDISYRFNN